MDYLKKETPDWSIAVGNPCRVLRKITENDRRKVLHNEEIDDEAWNVISSGIKERENNNE